jgi:hypothetical protein
MVVGSSDLEQPANVATNTSHHESRMFGFTILSHRLERNREVTKVTPILEALLAPPERQRDLPARLSQPETALSHAASK